MSLVFVRTTCSVRLVFTFFKFYVLSPEYQFKKHAAAIFRLSSIFYVNYGPIYLIHIVEQLLLSADFFYSVLIQLCTFISSIDYEDIVGVR